MKNKKADSHALRKLIPYVSPYKSQLGMIMLLVGCLLVVQLARPLLLKFTIDHYLVPHNLQGLNLIIVVFIFLLILEFAFFFGQAYLTEYISQNVMANLRLDVFRKIEDQSMAFFDRNKVGGLISRLTSDIDKLEDMFTTGLIDTVVKLAMIIIIIGIIFVLNAPLALITIALMPVTLLIFYYFSIFVISRYRELRVLAAKLSGYLQENISNMKIIQVFNQKQRHLHEFTAINHDLSQTNNRIIFSFALLFPLIEIFASVTVGALLWYGGAHVLTSTLTIGTLIAFIDYAQKLFNPLKDISERYNVIQSATASAERIFGLLESTDYVMPEGTIRLTQTTGAIQLQNLHFAYLPNEWVLKDINLTIHPGEKIAIVGATGSGKSTILKLLLRLYEPQQGDILLDQIPIRQYTQQSLRTQFGYITQDPYLFSDSIANNIRLFDEAIDQSQIERAAQATRSADFIEKLPDGYAHQLQEKGSNLSVGEKQLLALSRLAALNPPIFMLDEATAHIDVMTEALIEENLQRFMQHRTSIIVAHRLSTIKSVDRIIVMDKGRIVEQGTHQALLKQQGLYATLHKYQYKFME